MSESVHIKNGDTVKIVGSVAAVVVALGTIHAYFVVPGILLRSNENTKELIKAHKEAGVHPGAATRHDLDAEARVIQAQIQNIDTKVQHNSRQLDDVQNTVKNVEKILLEKNF